MKFGAVLVITLTIALMVLFVRSRIDYHKQKRDAAAFLTLTAMGWLLAILLVFFPDMPGPAQLMEAIYKPLGKILEK